MNIRTGGITKLREWIWRTLTASGTKASPAPQTSPVEVIHITAEEYTALKERLITQLKNEFEWWDRLAECHIKCSDVDYKLRYALALWLTDEDIADLHDEADRIRNA